MIFLIPSCDMMRGSSVRDRVRKIDWIGIALQGAFSTVFLVALTFAGNQFAWSSPFSIGMFSAAGIRHFLSQPDLKASFSYYLASARLHGCLAKLRKRGCSPWNCYTCGLQSYCSSLVEQRRYSLTLRCCTSHCISNSHV
jgi:hypothetical protein